MTDRLDPRDGVEVEGEYTDSELPLDAVVPKDGDAVVDRDLDADDLGTDGLAHRGLGDRDVDDDGIERVEVIEIVADDDDGTGRGF